MLPAHLEIVGVVSAHLDDEGTFYVIFAMNDGSRAATYWSREDLHRFLNVSPNSAKRVPFGASVQ